MQTIKSDWQTIKENYGKGWRLYYQIDRDNNTPKLNIYCMEHTGVISFNVILTADSDDYSEFMDKYKSVSNLSNTSAQGKVNTYSSPRPKGTTTYYCSIDDNPLDYSSVGGGGELFFEHKIGQPLIQNFYCNFNVIENETYIYDSVIGWQYAVNEKVTAQIVPEVSTIITATGTNYQSYGDIIIPSLGTGDVDVTDIKLVESPVDSLGNRSPSFWDADWNTTTKTFDNIIPNSLGTGQFNIFQNEIVLKQFVNKIHLIGNNNLRFGSQDIDKLWHGMRFKFILETDITLLDHDWQMNVMFFLYRAKTI